jgi:Methyltransferase domain
MIIPKSPVRRPLHSMTIPNSLRPMLLSAGRHARPEHLAYLCKVLSYLEAGHWLASEHPPPEMVKDDFAVFEIARHKIVGQAPLYLEFGVYEGRSMRWWSRNLSQPDAKLVGFDSFEGLPEDWSPWLRAGVFSTNGPPQMDDSRVSFQIGWFEETLPRFTIPDHDQIVLNVDCDLYSSASTVLRWAEPFLRPGSLIYFDEFPDRDHERKAFNELCERSSLQFKPVAVARSGANWLFETLEGASNPATSCGRTATGRIDLSSSARR